MKALRVGSLIVGILVYLVVWCYILYIVFEEVFWSLPAWMFGTGNVLAFYKAAGVTLLIVLLGCIFIPEQKRGVIILIPFDPDDLEGERAERTEGEE